MNKYDVAALCRVRSATQISLISGSITIETLRFLRETELVLVIFWLGITAILHYRALLILLLLYLINSVNC